MAPRGVTGCRPKWRAPRPPAERPKPAGLEAYANRPPRPELRLVFLLPATLSFAVRPGRVQPCLAGCRLDVDVAGLVTIRGIDRAGLFAQAARYLGQIARDHPAVAIAAMLTTQSLIDEKGRVLAQGGRDSWSIIVGAKIAFSPTALGAEMFGEAIVAQPDS